MTLDRPLIVLFAKAPIAGRVKTRLIGRLTPERAASLHRAFVDDLIERLGAHYELELHTDAPTGEWAQFEGTRRIQVEGGLGARMFAALSAGLAQGRSPVLVLGSDAPTVPLEHLDALLASRADVALGPAEDGGFFAISCRKVARGMFNGVSWSTEETLRETNAACERAGLKVEVGPGWYDIDSPDDLDRLYSDPNLPVATALWFDGAF